MTHALTSNGWIFFVLAWGFVMPSVMPLLVRKAWDRKQAERGVP